MQTLIWMVKCESMELLLYRRICNQFLFQGQGKSHSQVLPSHTKELRPVFEIITLHMHSERGGGGGRKKSKWAASFHCTKLLFSLQPLCALTLLITSKNSQQKAICFTSSQETFQTYLRYLYPSFALQMFYSIIKAAYTSFPQLFNIIIIK